MIVHANVMVKNESILLDELLPIWKEYPIDKFIFYNDNSSDSTVDIIKKHLSSRGENSEEEINNRIEAANGEIKLSNTFDYVITNQEGNIGYVIKEVKDIINKNL